MIADQKDGNYGSTMALSPNTAALTQVSTIGTRATGGVSMSDSTTTAGEILFVTSNKWNGNLVQSWKTVSKASTVTNPSTSNADVMYYTDTAFLKAASAADIYLDNVGTGLNWQAFNDGTNAVESESTFYTYESFVGGAAKTSASTPEATAYNATVDQAIALLKTLRVGFKVTQTTANGATSNEDKFFVYALAGSTSYVTNSSISVNTSTGDAEGFTKAVGQATEGTADAAVSAYNSANINNFTSSIPVLADTAMATGNGTAIGTKGTESALASVQPNEQVQVDIYVWMEGCDYDTVAGNISSFADANITGMQFGFCLAQ